MVLLGSMSAKTAANFYYSFLDVIDHMQISWLLSSSVFLNMLLLQNTQ